MPKSMFVFRAWFVSALLAASACVQANDLKVVAPNAVKESVVEIAARFEKDSGRRVSLSWGGSEAIAKRVADGEVFDVVVNTAPGVDRMRARRGISSLRISSRLPTGASLRSPGCVGKLAGNVRRRVPKSGPEALDVTPCVLQVPQPIESR